MSIGAIKPKTNSDFNIEKADLDKIRDEFQLELGYCYTLPTETSKGHSYKIVHPLLSKVTQNNIRASMELNEDTYYTNSIQFAYRPSKKIKKVRSPYFI